MSYAMPQTPVRLASAATLTAPTPLGSAGGGNDSAGGWLSVTNGLPPPLSQADSSSSPAVQLARHSVFAVPAGFSSSSRSGKRKANSGRKGRALAKDGQVIAKCYFAQGSRPFPQPLPLTDQITVTLDGLFPAWHTTSAVANTFAGLSVALTSFTSGSYTALFDQYRIDQLEAWIEPDLGVGGTVHGGQWASAVDLDDAANPTTSADVTNKQGAIVGGISTGQYHRWKPHMAIAAYSGAFTSYANEVANWIDCGSPGVIHYGLKTCFPITSSGAVTYSLNLRAVISFRAPHI